MSAPNLPRFKVASSGNVVLDTWDAHRIVAYFSYPTGAGGRILSPSVLARDRCAELEAWHEQAMADGT